MSEARQTWFHSLHQILVAFDHAPFSVQAMRLALALAARAEAEVTAVHVVPPMLGYFRQVLFPYAAMGADEPGIEAELLEAARAALLESTAELRAPYAGTRQGDELYAHLYYGEVLVRIHESIARSNADLVLCGAFGERTPTPGRLGGVASALVAAAHRPTLLVKQPSGPVAVRRVLIALDGSRLAGGLLNWGVSLALQLGAEDVQLVTVVPDPTRDDPAGLLSGLRVPRDLEERGTERARKQTERALETLYVPFPAEDRARALSMKLNTLFGDPRDTIVRLVDEGDFDLVVVASRHPDNPYRSRFGRVAEGVARLAGCHVLVVPASLCEPTESDKT